MTNPTTDPNDDALDAALRGMTRPTIDPARRDAHIAAALGALDGAPDNVVSLASRRRAQVMSLTAVAAAALFVVGLGIGRASAPKADTPSRVKNVALAPTRGAAGTPVRDCPKLSLGTTGEFITTFGTYALYRTTDAAPTLVVVDTAACTIVARVAASTADGG